MIIADKRIPGQAKEKLLSFDDVLFLETEGITYKAISGHPDIFFCKAGEKLVIAPNIPLRFKEEIKKHSIAFVEGKKPVGAEYPDTAIYNAVVTENYLIHNLKYTDNAIMKAAGNLKRINVNQAYAQCNMLSLPEDRFITSDRGIEKTLKNKGLEILFISPRDILLPGFEYGFLGGTCGIFESKLLLLGNLKYFKDGEKVFQFLRNTDLEIVELYDGPLFDGGSILVL